MPVASVFRDDMLAGKVAFVTGGGSGICKGMTEALLRHGCNAVITSRTLTKLQEAAKELSYKTGKKCLVVAADVRKPDELAAAVNLALDTFGRIDIVVCGAAGNFLAPAEQLSYRAFRTVVEIDLIGTFNTIKACIEPLKRTGGSIINISSTLQYAGTPLQVHAASAKNGVDALTRVLAIELGNYGIRVNSIAPGPIEGTEGMTRLTPPGASDKLIASIPLKRFGTIQDIENAALYLVSEAASYVTGTILVVDGGSWMTMTGLMYPTALNMFLKNKKPKANL